jgi:hypothetical protein
MGAHRAMTRAAHHSRNAPEKIFRLRAIFSATTCASETIGAVDRAPRAVEARSACHRAVIEAARVRAVTNGRSRWRAVEVVVARAADAIVSRADVPGRLARRIGPGAHARPRPGTIAGRAATFEVGRSRSFGCAPVS